MSLKSWRKAAFILAIVGAIQFVILISIAMIFYAGGSFLNPSTPGYSIWLNSWSDLGRTIAWSGENNLISFVFFSLSMVLWGISFFPSIQALSSFFSDSERGKLYCKIGTISAYICFLALLINVFFFPADIYPLLHIICSVFGYLTLLIVEVLYAIVMFLDEKYPNKLAICFLAVVMVIIIYFIFNNPITQKIVSFTLTIATVIVFSDAWKRIDKKNE